jgi:MFS family permease
MKVFLNKPETILINYAHAFLVLIGLMQVNPVPLKYGKCILHTFHFCSCEVSWSFLFRSRPYEVGLIVSIYSAATLLSSFIFGKFADFHNLRAVLLGGSGFSVAAFLLQIFTSSPLL